MVPAPRWPQHFHSTFSSEGRTDRQVARRKICSSDDWQMAAGPACKPAPTPTLKLGLMQRLRLMQRLIATEERGSQAQTRRPVCQWRCSRGSRPLTVDCFVCLSRHFVSPLLLLVPLLGWGKREALEPVSEIRVMPAMEPAQNMEPVQRKVIVSWASERSGVKPDHGDRYS